jgi:hypothetical protein
MPTPSLREVQRLFWRSIASAPGALAAPRALLEVSAPSATLDPAARPQVYADAYFWRLRDVLAENFPRLAAILGPERFEDLAREYLERHPSEHPSLRFLGRGLAAIVARHADQAPALVDLARLEWARVEVFDAADCETLTVEALRSIRPEDWPSLRFVPIQALAVLRFTWPAHEVWDGADAGTLTPRPGHVRVWRARDDRVFHAPMDTGEGEALERLIAGAPFEVVCQAFDDLPPPAAAERMAGLLGRWLDDGIVRAFQTPSFS